MTLLAIGLDGFDTPEGGCTTHLASLLVLKLLHEGYTLLDYPWLIRLNPAVPWKTRGNGAVILLVEVDSRGEAEAVINTARKLAEDYDVEKGKATLIILEFGDVNELLEETLTRTLYVKALTSYVIVEEAATTLRKMRKRLRFTYGASRRSLIGALAALGGLRPGDDQSFELLAYRFPRFWATERRINPWTVILFDTVTGLLTFSNYDYEKAAPLIAPHGPDPVLYGLRGEDPSTLIKGLSIIDAGEPIAHWTIFRTNQGTDAHLVHALPCTLQPYTVTRVEGVVENIKFIKGGHALITLKTMCPNARTVTAAVYRETGRLHAFVRKVLEVHASIRVYGIVKPHGDRLTLNVEKIEVSNITENGIEYFVPRTNIVVPSARALHHLTKPFERYLASMLGATTVFRGPKPTTLVAGH